MMVKDLPFPLKIVGAGAAPKGASRHLDELWLILFQPESQKNKIGGLEHDGFGASRAVVKEFSIQQVVEPLDRDVQLCRCF
jgi:hypothetical protein